jgi:hypothetical protein
MECPHCHKYISSQKNHCIYCGGKIERSVIRNILNFLRNEKIIGRRFIESLANGTLPIIKSTKELELYIKYKVQDEEAAVIISEAFEQAGREAVLEIKRGRDGKPYKVEYIPNKIPSNMSRKEIEDRVEQLLQRMRNEDDLTNYDKENIQSELAQLARYHVIIWINSFSKEEFDAREQLIMKAIGAATEGITREMESSNANE